MEGRGIATRAGNGDDIALGILDDLAGYHLRRASSVFANDFARALAGTGMRQVLFGILSIIAANPRINQGNVGRALGIQRANMVSLVNELVDRDLVLREVAADDRRAFSLTLTPAGRKIVAQCVKLIEAHEARLLADLSAKERTALIAMLSRIEAKEA
ncbi:MarR family transcriptional regulator [Sphingomonas gilva]|uniref:MarR family transcriptional regulator n=1 Tax=Sphingomonas gilva TaxID=2305907 RepID=A0A396RRR5_9SPHN|nr:MarR family transcriptional regulator [Sphingomonas gilva]RHW19238.1 MarR family transcriptional regulator [Sphingomonas gilva]